MKTRNQLHLLAKHSDVSSEYLQSRMKDLNVYASENNVRHFLSKITLGLGAALTLSAIIYFFAYNWQEMSKFLKFNLLQGLIIFSIIPVLFLKNNLVKNILVTATTVIIGVLFAVFGQVYQTGANAYDFFLTWSLAVTVFCLIVDFYPIKLILLILTQTTLYLYVEQVHRGMDFEEQLMYHLISFIGSLGFFIATSFVKLYKEMPKWFSRLLVFSILLCACIGTTMSLFDDLSKYFEIIWGITIPLLLTLVIYGNKKRDLFPITLVILFMLNLLGCLIIKGMEETTMDDIQAMFLVMAIFIIASTTLSIKGLINVNRYWNGK